MILFTFTLKLIYEIVKHNEIFFSNKVFMDDLTNIKQLNNWKISQYCVYASYVRKHIQFTQWGVPIEENADI